MKPVLFRTDASPAIGTGHSMRCLALAQTLGVNGIPSAFLSSVLPAEIGQRLREEKCTLQTLQASAYGKEDAQETTRCAQQIGAEWIVVDGYSFDARYQELVRESGSRLLFLDDYGHCDRYSADVVLNQNISAREELYAKREQHTRLLLGTAYVLLRKEFLASAGAKRDTPRQARKILVTLGGGDPDNLTEKVLHAIAGIPAARGLELSVVIGGSNPHRNSIERMLLASALSAQVHINTAQMPHLMAEADVAIAAGGTTSYELAFMGLPSLCIVIADNQREIAQKMNDEEVMQSLGWHENVTDGMIVSALSSLMKDPAKRATMSVKGRTLVDGKGAERVLETLRGSSSSAPSHITLRPMKEEDCRMLWEWANDPVVRAASFTTESIPWDEHRQWFERKLRDPHCRMYVALNETNTPVGQIRFDIKDDEADVDVHLAPDKRGKGYGTTLIREGLRAFFHATHVRTVHSFIKMDNSASRNAFLRAECTEQKTEHVHGQEVYHFTCQRP